MLDSLKSIQELLLVIFLQSLDVMRIDFIDSIISIVKSEVRFICISIDYMTRYFFTNIMSIVISKNIVIFFERFVMSHFDWSRIIYSDNDAHFKKTFDEKLLKQKIKHYFVSINHLSSMNLTKRYVRLVLNVFKIILQHHIHMIFEWDLLFQTVMKIVNTRMIKAFDYSLTQLLLRFQSKYIEEKNLYENVLRFKAIKDKIKNILERSVITIDETMIVEERNFEEKLIKLDEMRDLALEKRLEINETLVKKIDTKKKTKKTSKEKNLIKLKRLEQNNQKSHKLESRWEDSYKIEKITNNKKSLWLQNLNIEELKDKFHVNDIVVFLLKIDYTKITQDWKIVANVNNQIRSDVKVWMRTRTVERKKTMHQQDKNFTEKNVDTDALSQEWWNVSFIFSFEEYDDELDWNYWRKKNIAINL